VNAAYRPMLDVRVSLRNVVPRLAQNAAAAASLSFSVVRPTTYFLQQLKNTTSEKHELTKRSKHSTTTYKNTNAKVKIK